MNRATKGIIKGLFVSGLLLISVVCSSQTEVVAEKVAEKEFKYALSFEPLYLFNAGIRFNFETLLKGDQRQVLQISAIGYYNDWYDDDWETLLLDNTYGSNKVAGGGVGVDYRLFPSSQYQKFYVSGGISYHYFSLNHDACKLVSFTEDDLVFYEPVMTTSNTPFNKFGANFCLGLQNRKSKVILTDIYMGAGYSYGFFDEEKYTPGNTMHSIGYRGITLLLGFRLGFRFGKVH